MNPLKNYTKARWGNLSRLAKHVGVTPAAVHHWEYVPARHLRAVSEYTGIPVEDLLPPQGAKQPPATSLGVPPQTGGPTRRDPLWSRLFSSLKGAEQ
jgi:hypothetical protein